MLDLDLLLTVLRSLATALAVTLVVEVSVATLFRVGRQGLVIVTLINIVTNPLLNFALLVLSFLIDSLSSPDSATDGTNVLVVTASLLEVLVVVMEWRLLVWSLGSSVGNLRRMLVLSLTMNVASMLAGIGLLTKR